MAASSTPGFQKLPLEIRHMVYELLLSRQRVIPLNGKTDRVTSFGPLTQTCKQIKEEVKMWFDNTVAIQERWEVAPRYGLIKTNYTTFEFNLDQAFRDLERCTVSNENPDLQDWSFAADSKWTMLIPPDFTYISHITLNFRTEDKWNVRHLTDASPSRRDNQWAMFALRKLPYLRTAEFFIGGGENDWQSFTKESWDLLKSESELQNGKLRWVPVAADFAMPLVDFVDSDELTQNNEDDWEDVEGNDKDDVEQEDNEEMGEGEGKSEENEKEEEPEGEMVVKVWLVRLGVSNGGPELLAEYGEGENYYFALDNRHACIGGQELEVAGSIIEEL